MNPNSAWTRVNSTSERPCCTCMLELRRWFMTLFAKEANEMMLLWNWMDRAAAAAQVDK